MYWFEKYCPNVPLNQYGGTFCLQYMNAMQGGKPSGIQWNRLIDVVVMILKYKKIAIYRAIYIKVFSDGNVSYLMVSIDGVLNRNNNDTLFT